MTPGAAEIPLRQHLVAVAGPVLANNGVCTATNETMSAPVSNARGFPTISSFSLMTRWLTPLLSKFRATQRVAASGRFAADRRGPERSPEATE